MSELRNATTEELLDELAGRKDRELAEWRKRWPKTYTDYAHMNVVEDEDFQKFARTVWGEDNDTPDSAWYIGYEIKLRFEVRKDGTAKVIAVNGIKVSDEEDDMEEDDYHDYAHLVNADE